MKGKLRLGGSGGSAMDIAETYAQHGAFVWRTLLRFGVVESAADDALQDVFLILHRRRADFDGSASVRPWLYGIARKVAHRYRERECRARFLLELDQDTNVLQFLPQDYVALREAAQFVDEFVHSLNEDRRELFILAVLEQMNVVEVAELLQINVNTAYSRLRSTRQEFTAALARLQARERRLTRSRG